MEPIITKEFALGRKEYSNILISTDLKKIMKFLLAFFFLAFLMWVNSDNSYAGAILKLAIIALIIVPLITYLKIESLVGHKENRFMFSPCKFTFDESKLICYDIEMNTSIEIAYKRVVKQKQTKQHYLLFTNKFMAYTLPKEVFQSEEDHQRFKELFNFND